MPKSATDKHQHVYIRQHAYQVIQILNLFTDSAPVSVHRRWANPVDAVRYYSKLTWEFGADAGEASRPWPPAVARTCSTPCWTSCWKTPTADDPARSLKPTAGPSLRRTSPDVERTSARLPRKRGVPPTTQCRTASVSKQANLYSAIIAKNT